MPHDPEAFADMVVLTVKAAMAPVLERLAVSEQCNRDLQARVSELTALRDRVTVVETKAALPVPEPPEVDLSPVLERIAATEQASRELHARFATIETKAAAPVVPDIYGLAAGVASGPSAADIELSMRDKLEPLTKEVGALRERLIAVEVRQPVPGPPGEKGQDGINGKDGVDGMGWDDLAVEHDGERTFSVKLMRGERVKEAGVFTVPVDIYRGVYIDGRTYQRGDGVTFGGSEFHCNEPTATKPESGSKAWTLKVKRGRDGKDGKDATTLPVVSVRP